MAPLKLLAAFSLMVASQPGKAEPVSDPIARWQSYIGEASRRFGISEAWIAKVMRAESGGRTELDGRPITSSVGAMGLMQVMPATWAEMRRLHDLGPDPHDPRDNILAGTAFLAEMYRRFGYPGLFAAYHAGPGRYADHVAGRRSLPGATHAYVRQLTGGRIGQSSVPTPPNILFFVERRRSSSTIGSSNAASLFVPLTAPSSREPRGR